MPKMNPKELVKGYQHVLATIYDPHHYYARISTLLQEYKPIAKTSKRIQKSSLFGLFNSIWFVGIREKGRRYYWKLFADTLIRKPKVFPMFVTLTVYGYHFRKVIAKTNLAPSGGLA
jgi:hypothetical protein